MAIIIAIICLGAWAFSLNKSSQNMQSTNVFHPSDYMDDQRSLNNMFNNQQLRSLQIDSKNDTIYMDSGNGFTKVTKNLTTSYNQLPNKHRLLINHVDHIDHDQYVIYWSTMYNTKMDISHHIYTISPMGNKDHIFNKYNLNHEGYFIFSSKKEPQLMSKLHKLQYKNKQLFMNSNDHMM